MRGVFILSAVRIPIGKCGGSLRHFSAPDLAVVAARAAPERAGVPPEEVQEIIFGHARQAIESGRFSGETVPVSVKEKRGERIFDTDEHPRLDTTPESLAKPLPAFSKTGTISAGNSSGMTDGAAALVLASEEPAGRSAVKPLARICAYTAAGADPRLMGIGPVPAVRKLLQKTDRPLEGFDVVDLNEAFAAEVLARDRELHFDRSRLNPNGGAIALGHPIGCTGAPASP